MYLKQAILLSQKSKQLDYNSAERYFQIWGFSLLKLKSYVVSWEPFPFRKRHVLKTHRGKYIQSFVFQNWPSLELSPIKRDTHKCPKNPPENHPETALFLSRVLWDLKSTFSWFLAHTSYFVQQLFTCASPCDPSAISFGSFTPKSPFAARIDLCQGLSPELCVPTFLTLITETPSAKCRSH